MNSFFVFFLKCGDVTFYKKKKDGHAVVKTMAFKLVVFLVPACNFKTSCTSTMKCMICKVVFTSAREAPSGLQNLWAKSTSLHKILSATVLSFQPNGSLSFLCLHVFSWLYYWNFIVSINFFATFAKKSLAQAQVGVICYTFFNC